MDGPGDGKLNGLPDDLISPDGALDGPLEREERRKEVKKTPGSD